MQFDAETDLTYHLNKEYSLLSMMANSLLTSSYYKKYKIWEMTSNCNIDLVFILRIQLSC